MTCHRPIELVNTNAEHIYFYTVRATAAAAFAKVVMCVWLSVIQVFLCVAVLGDVC